MLSLIASNVATILSDQVHQKAFGLVERVVSLADETVASALLSRSTTQVRREDAERAALSLRVERDAIRAERDLALSRHRALEIENEKVKRAAAAAKAERDAVKALAAKRAATVQKIARNTTTRLAARSAESVTSLPLRAAPYVGIAVLLTTTGLELQADCDLAKSLADLNAEHANEPIDVGSICRRVNSVPTREQLWKDVKARASASQRVFYETLQATFPRWETPDSAQPPASAPADKLTSSATP